MAYDTSTFDPKAAAEARKAEMEEITGKLESGVKEVFNGDNYKNYLDFCARLPRYSVNNQILIMMQKPDATMCQSFTNWKEVNRFVRKGEKGIRILAPAPYKMQKEQDKTDSSGKTILDRDGEPVKETVEVTINAFKPVSTFDISQTDGDPVPTPGVEELTGSVEGYETLLAAIKEVVPVPISFEQIDSGAKGFYHLEENRIVVQEGMSEAQTVKTLLHEASHQALHSREAMDASSEKKSKNQKETEAESVAYVVCQHYGIDTSEYSFPYVATWSADKEVPELKASLDTIRRTASELIVKIDEKVQSLTTVKEMDQFMEAHGDELPFDNPEADKPFGYIKIEPPVDFGEMQPEKTIKLSVESSKEADKKPEKTTKEKAVRKTSVKDKLKAEKAKSEKTKSPKKSADKDMREAI
jgi:antirestriction protein ArdC